MKPSKSQVSSKLVLWTGLDCVLGNGLGNGLVECALLLPHRSHTQFNIPQSKRDPLVFPKMRSLRRVERSVFLLKLYAYCYMAIPI